MTNEEILKKKLLVLQPPIFVESNIRDLESVLMDMQWFRIPRSDFGRQSLERLLESYVTQKLWASVT